MYQHHSLLRKLFNTPAYFRSNVIRRYKKKIKEAIKIRTGDPGKQVELMHTNDRTRQPKHFQEVLVQPLPFRSSKGKKKKKKNTFRLAPIYISLRFFFQGQKLKKRYSAYSSPISIQVLFSNSSQELKSIPDRNLSTHLNSCPRLTNPKAVRE